MYILHHKNDFILFLKLYFIDYAIRVALIFPPLPPLHSTPSLWQSPPPLFMSMGHMYKFFVYTTYYTVLYIPMAIR